MVILTGGISRGLIAVLALLSAASGIVVCANRCTTLEAPGLLAQCPKCKMTETVPETERRHECPRCGNVYVVFSRWRPSHRDDGRKWDEPAAVGGALPSESSRTRMSGEQSPLPDATGL